ncbi:hypothetical protein LguiA_014206 [Lonicera macranthoides]
MVLGWRRAFCSSISRDRGDHSSKEEQINSNSSPRIGSKFGFFSNPSTPRLQSQPGLRCRTTATEEATVLASESPKQLRCKTKENSKLFHSNPSSPRSPSTLSLLKSTLRLSKSRCGICLQTVKAGQGMAIFTAECSHSFHFPCIANHMKKQCSLLCPVCSYHWKEMPLLSIDNTHKPVCDEKQIKVEAKSVVKSTNERNQHYLKVYNDDEPLMSPTKGVRFNPIPESDEENEQDNDNGVEFQGFSVNTSPTPISDLTRKCTNVEVTLPREAVVVAVRRSCQAQLILLKIRAPPAQTKANQRAPIDVVTVIDVSGNINKDKLQIMKRTMKLILSHLSTSDRFSIVAFSSSSKRLLPLRRMTTNGRRSARRIVDAMVAVEGKSSANDAMKKAAKVLEDRRDRNSVASIILLSDFNSQTRTKQLVSSTRHPNLDIPVHSIQFGACPNAPNDETFGQCIKSLLSVVVQDLRVELGFYSGSAPAEIAAVYSYTSSPVALGTGSLRVGDLYAEEERDLLVELKVPSSAIGAQHVLSFRCCYTDAYSKELIHSEEQALPIPRAQATRTAAPEIQRLRNIFVTTRAVAESRRLMERNNLSGANHMLSSARALLLQSSSSSANEFVIGLDAEMAELQRRRESLIQRRRGQLTERFAFLDEKGEPLTPTSAWRAAEKLAKVAIMRKSLNRVGDLHGFEDARF